MIIEPRVKPRGTKFGLSPRPWRAVRKRTALLRTGKWNRRNRD